MVRPWLHYVVMSLALLISLLVLLSPCLRQLGKVAAIPWRMPWVFKLALAIYCGGLALIALGNRWLGKSGSIGWMLPEKPVVNVWGCLNISHHKLDFTPEIYRNIHSSSHGGAKKAPETVGPKNRIAASSNFQLVAIFRGPSRSPRPIHMELSTPLGGCGLWYAEPIRKRCLRHDDGQMFSCRESRGVFPVWRGMGWGIRFKKKRSQDTILVVVVWKEWTSNDTRYFKRCHGMSTNHLGERGYGNVEMCMDVWRCFKDSIDGILFHERSCAHAFWYFIYIYIGVFDLYIGQRHLDVKTHCFANSAGSELPWNSQDGWRLWRR